MRYSIVVHIVKWFALQGHNVEFVLCRCVRDQNFTTINTFLRGNSWRTLADQHVAMRAPSSDVGRQVAFDQPYRRKFSPSGSVSTTADAILRSINLIDGSFLQAVQSRRQRTPFWVWSTLSTAVFSGRSSLDDGTLWSDSLCHPLDWLTDCHDCAMTS